MSTFTHTRTTWGELTVTALDDDPAHRRQVIATCKACSGTAVTVIGPDDNPFGVRPRHQADCPLTAPPPRRTVAGAAAPTIAGRAVSWRVLAGVGGALAALGGLLGWALG